MDYSSLIEMMAVPDIADGNPFGAPRTAGHAPARTHAVRVSDGEVVHPYEQRETDVSKPDQDWMTLHPGDRCKQCAEVLDVEGRL